MFEYFIQTLPTIRVCHESPFSQGNIASPCSGEHFESVPEQSDTNDHFYNEGIGSEHQSEGDGFHSVEQTSNNVHCECEADGEYSSNCDNTYSENEQSEKADHSNKREEFEHNKVDKQQSDDVDVECNEGINHLSSVMERRISTSSTNNLPDNDESKLLILFPDMKIIHSCPT